MNPDRRCFLQSAVAITGVAHTLSAQSAFPYRPRLGVVARVTGKETPDQALARVHSFGLPTCQVSVGMSPPGLAEELQAALKKYQIEATAAMTLGEGPMVWDFEQGPATIGIVPLATRTARLNALKRASDLAKQCDIGAVHTHCGFIPEDPHDPTYPGVVAAIREIASYCQSNQQQFLMETGQETPITLLRTIHDVGLENVGVNLDVANLILYGKGEAIGALDVIGKYVRGLHAKDGLYPTDPQKLGKEVPIGKGRVDFPGVIRSLQKWNYTGPITIERETSGPQQEADIRASKKYLETLIEKIYV